MPFSRRLVWAAGVTCLFLFVPKIYGVRSESTSEVTRHQAWVNSELQQFQQRPSPDRLRSLYFNLRATDLIDGEERVIRPRSQQIIGAGSLSALNETVRELFSNRNFTGNLQASLPLYQPRIIGSIGIIRHRFIVNIETAANVNRCSGILIAENAVLTALHCHCAAGNEIRAVHVPLGQGRSQRYVVRAHGVHGYWRQPPIDRTDACKQSGAHFSQGRTPRGEDVALVMLEASIPRQIAAPLMDFATQDQLSRARAAIVSGYGKTEHDTQNFNQNHSEARATTVILQLTCRNCQSGEEFAADRGTSNANNDTCGGDSGGPLFLFSQRSFNELAQKYGGIERIPPDEFLNESQIVLAGLVSRAMHERGRCGDGGIYTDLTARRFRDFLQYHSVSVHSLPNFEPFAGRSSPGVPNNPNAGR